MADQYYQTSPLAWSARPDPPLTALHYPLASNFGTPTTSASTSATNSPIGGCLTQVVLSSLGSCKHATAVLLVASRLILANNDLRPQTCYFEDCGTTFHNSGDLFLHTLQCPQWIHGVHCENCGGSGCSASVKHTGGSRPACVMPKRAGVIQRKISRILGGGGSWSKASSRASSPSPPPISPPVSRGNPVSVYPSPPGPSDAHCAVQSHSSASVQMLHPLTPQGPINGVGHSSNITLLQSPGSAMASLINDIQTVPRPMQPDHRINRAELSTSRVWYPSDSTADVLGLSEATNPATFNGAALDFLGSNWQSSTPFFSINTDSDWDVEKGDRCFNSSSGLQIPNTDTPSANSFQHIQPLTGQNQGRSDCFVAARPVPEGIRANKLYQGALPSLQTEGLGLGTPTSFRCESGSMTSGTEPTISTPSEDSITESLTLGVCHISVTSPLDSQITVPSPSPSTPSPTDSLSHKCHRCNYSPHGSKRKLWDTYLKKHVATKHGSVRYTCCACGNRFTRKDNLEVHRRKTCKGNEKA